MSPDSHANEVSQRTLSWGLVFRSAFRKWLVRLLSDLKAAPAGRRFSLLPMVVWPLVFCIGLTLWSRAVGFDLGAQQWIYAAGGNSWSFGDHPFWYSIYKWGPIPAVIVVFAALAAYSLSWRIKRLKPSRRIIVFVILTAVIGPGIITNALLKEYWGRPRPRELVDFGGRYPFEPVFTMNPASSGLSFPCGHATMGFVFVAGFFLLRRHRKGLAEGFLFTSLILGTLMGIARMAQGGHFFTDVIWAGAICYFTPMVLYYAMGLDRSLFPEAEPDRKKMPWPVRIGVSVMGAAMLAAVLVGSPYDERHDYSLTEDFDREGPLDVRLRFTVGHAEIVPAGEFRLTGRSHGHGLPTSGISVYHDEVEGDDYSSFIYAERISGWFSEIDSNTRVELPWHRIRRLHLETGDADVRLDLAGVPGRPVIEVASGDAEIEVRTGGIPLRVSGGGVGRLIGSENLVPSSPGKGFYRMQIAPEFSGVVRIQGSLEE